MRSPCTAVRLDNRSHLHSLQRPASVAAMSSRSVELKWNFEGGHWENELGERTDEYGRITRPRGQRGGKGNRWSTSWGGNAWGDGWGTQPQAFHFLIAKLPVSCFKLLEH